MTSKAMLVIPVVAIAMACGSDGSSSADGRASDGRPAFEHEISSGPVPWTHEAFDVRPDDFSFAVIGDLTGGERPRIFEVAMEQLALLRPELILAVGDLIDGVSEAPDDLHAEWNSFDERAAIAGAPLFHVGGNHDVTAEALRAVWADRYGPLYYHFVYEDVLFLVLDSEDYPAEFRRRITGARNEAVALLNAGDSEGYTASEYYRMPERQTGRIGPEQAAYFERVIAVHPEVRWTMLFMHKPVWKADSQPGFSAVEAALADRPYSVFAGHYHIFSHEVRNGRDYTQLGTTGGSQSATDEMAFDHVTLVRMTDEGPSISHLRQDGILDRTGHIPAGGDTLCYQASRCGGGD